MRARYLASLVCFALVGCPGDGNDSDSDSVVATVETCADALDAPSNVPRECKDLQGIAQAAQPGELAVVPFTIKTSVRMTELLGDFELAIKARTGQALPGLPLSLKLGERVLQEVALGGQYGNEAVFRVALDRSVCTAVCEVHLTVSGPVADADVPVPVELVGSVVARLPVKRSFAVEPNDFSLEVGNAR